MGSGCFSSHLSSSLHLLPPTPSSPSVPSKEVLFSRSYRQLNSSGLSCQGDLKLLDHYKLNLITSERRHFRMREHGTGAWLENCVFRMCGVLCCCVSPCVLSHVGPSDSFFSPSFWPFYKTLLRGICYP